MRLYRRDCRPQTNNYTPKQTNEKQNKNRKREEKRIIRTKYIVIYNINIVELKNKEAFLAKSISRRPTATNRRLHTKHTRKQAKYLK